MLLGKLSLGKYLPLDEDVQLMPPHLGLVESRESRYHRIGVLDVRIVVNAPVGLTNFASGMEQTCPDVVHDERGTNGVTNTLNGLYDPINNVGTRLEKVWPQEVEQVNHRILAVKTDTAQGDVLDY